MVLRWELFTKIREGLFFGHIGEGGNFSLALQPLLEVRQSLTRQAIVQVHDYFDIVLQRTDHSSKVQVEQQKYPEASQREGRGRHGNQRGGSVETDVRHGFLDKIGNSPHAQPSNQQPASPGQASGPAGWPVP